jgi:hypothetical protein
MSPKEEVKFDEHNEIVETDNQRQSLRQKIFFLNKKKKIEKKFFIALYVEEGSKGYFKLWAIQKLGRFWNICIGW